MENKELDQLVTVFDVHQDALEKATEISNNLQCAVGEGEVSSAQQASFESLMGLNSIKSIYGLRSVDSLIDSYSKIVSIENINREPFGTLRVSIESFALFIEKILVKLKNLIVHFLRKFRDWITMLVRYSSLLKNDAEDLVKAVSRAQSEIKFFPETLDAHHGLDFLNWMYIKHPISRYLCNSLIVKNYGEQYFGRNLLNLPIREFNYEYPTIDKLSLGSYSSCGESLISFYDRIDINSCPEILNNRNELGDLILEKLYPKEEDRLEAICKVYALDTSYAYYMVIRSYKNKKPKIDFSKINFMNIEKSFEKINPNEINKLFGGNIVDYIVETCRYISRDVNKTIQSGNMISNRLRKIKDEVDKLIYNYRTVSTDEVVKDNLNSYSKLINKLITNYYYANIGSSFKTYRSLYRIASKLYNDLLSQAGIARQNA